MQPKIRGLDDDIPEELDGSGRSDDDGSVGPVESIRDDDVNRHLSSPLPSLISWMTLR